MGVTRRTRVKTKVEAYSGTCVASTAHCENHSLLKVGRFKLTISKPVSPWSMLSALKIRFSYAAFNVCLQF